VTDLVPAAEFAESLGRSVQTIYSARYRNSDIPPAITISGRIYFAQEDIDDWLDGKRQAARAEMEDRQRALDRGVEHTTKRRSAPEQQRAAGFEQATAALSQHSHRKGRV
jgi:predicted DNA-binding transcriptional regulator AlpA